MFETPVEFRSEFRLGAALRRCAWYVVFGVACAFALSALLKDRGLVRNDTPWTAFVLGAVILLSGTLGLLVVTHRWRLRIDENGLAPRRFWRWDLWTWAEFSGGHVQWHSDGFISPARPWRRNTLAFSVLDEKDRTFVLDACRHYLRPVKETQCETFWGELALRYQVFNTVTFCEEGDRGRNYKHSFEFGWSEIKEVRLLYSDHFSKVLRGIELDVTGRTVLVNALNKITSPSFGSKRVIDPKIVLNVVEDYLRKYVPPEKPVRHALHGPPETLAEWESRTYKLKRELRKIIWLYRTLPVVFLIFSLICFCPKLITNWQQPHAFPHVGWSVLTTLLIIAVALSQPVMLWAILRELWKRRTTMLYELAAWKNEHNGQNASHVFPQRVFP